MLPETGSISMNDVRTELGKTGTISLGDTDVRSLAGIASGKISMNDLRGKSSHLYSGTVHIIGNILDVSGYESENSFNPKELYPGQKLMEILYSNTSGLGGFEVGIISIEKGNKTPKFLKVGIGDKVFNFGSGTGYSDNGVQSGWHTLGVLETQLTEFGLCLLDDNPATQVDKTLTLTIDEA